jgi:hypothetical protein
MRARKASNLSPLPAVCGVSSSRPGGPTAKRQPSPEGLGINDRDSARPGLPWERRRRGTIRVILHDMSHSYSNKCFHGV